MCFLKFHNFSCLTPYCEIILEKISSILIKIFHPMIKVIIKNTFVPPCIQITILFAKLPDTTKKRAILLRNIYLLPVKHV